MKDSTVQATSNLLTVEQVAEHIGTDDLTIQRLIALRRLDATRWGDSRKWLVRAAELDRFIGQTTQGFDVPPHDGRWFKTERHNFQWMQSLLIPAIQSQVPTELPRDAKGQPITRLQLRLTNKVRAVLNHDANAERTDVTYRDAGEQAMVDELRRFAKRLAAKSSPALLSEIQKLYASPDAFDAIRPQAIVMWTEAAFAWVKEYEAKGARQ